MRRPTRSPAGPAGRAGALTRHGLRSDNQVTAGEPAPTPDTPDMAQRRVGLWLIGACGGVGSTTALGLAALARGLTPTTGLVTALPRFAGLDLDVPSNFVVGGHDIRQATIL